MLLRGLVAGMVKRLTKSLTPPAPERPLGAATTPPAGAPAMACSARSASSAAAQRLMAGSGPRGGGPREGNSRDEMVGGGELFSPGHCVHRCLEEMARWVRGRLGGGRYPGRMVAEWRACPLTELPQTCALSKREMEEEWNVKKQRSRLGAAGHSLWPLARRTRRRSGGRRGRSWMPWPHKHPAAWQPCGISRFS